MIAIRPSQWIPNLFARVKTFSDVLLEPHENLFSLPPESLNKIRNTQTHPGDVVRVLGHHRDFCLIMKFDGSKGWMLRSGMEEDPAVENFAKPRGGTQTAAEFLEDFRDSPYLWGGLSPQGIDCSGFTQLYFLLVHDKILPRNSREQRKFRPERPFHAAKDQDLVYGLGKNGGGHHVGLYLDGRIWHASSHPECGGVVCHGVERFSQLFEVQASNSIL